MQHLDDPIELTRYLGQVADHPLLTREEEKHLARIWAKRGKKPTPAQVKAQRELITCNVKLVISIAKNYRGRGLPFIDIIQEGIIGLARGIDGFDPDRGIKLSTYATWWIRQACQRAVASQGATIRVPAQVNYRRARTYQIMQERPNATIEEIAKELECEVHHIEYALEVVRATSLDKSAGSENELSSIADTVADPNAADPVDVLEERDFIRRAEVHRVLERIDEEERDVIKLRFGFNGVHPHSFQEVAAALKIPTHRAQALQKSALRKLESLLESDEFISHGVVESEPRHVSDFRGTETLMERRGRAARAASSHTARRAPASAPPFTCEYAELIEEQVLGRCDCSYESDVHEHGADVAC